MGEERSAPRADGFSMPAEWEPHEACYMEWPTVTRKDFWGKRFEERDYAEVANAIAAFEPVVMVCDPEQEAEARTMCTQTVEILPPSVDDSWMRDNGPIFVPDDAGRYGGHCGALGEAASAFSTTFVSSAALEAGVQQRLQSRRRFMAVRGTRSVVRQSLVHNTSVLPVQVDPATER